MEETIVKDIYYTLNQLRVFQRSAIRKIQLVSRDIVPLHTMKTHHILSANKLLSNIILPIIASAFLSPSKRIPRYLGRKQHPLQKPFIELSERQALRWQRIHGKKQILHTITRFHQFLHVGSQNLR